MLFGTLDQQRIEFVHCKANTLVHSIGHFNDEDCLAALKLLP